MNESITWPVVAPSSISKTRYVEVYPSRMSGRVGLIVVDDSRLRFIFESVLLSPESARSLGAALLVAADEAEKARARK